MLLEVRGGHSSLPGKKTQTHLCELFITTATDRNIKKNGFRDQ